MPSKSLEYIFKAKDDGVISSMKEQGATADQLKAKLRELEEVKAAAGGGSTNGRSRSVRAVIRPEIDKDAERSALQQLNDKFGRGSDLGQLGRILKGGGAVFAIDMIAKQIGAAADKARELKAEFDSGKIGAAGVAEGFVQSLPVLGTVYNTLHSVADLLAQFPALSESWVGKLGLSSLKASEVIKRTEEVRKILLDAQAEALQKQIRLTRELADNTATTNRKVAAAGLDGFDKEDRGRRDALAERLQGNGDKRQDAIAEAEAARKKAAEELDKAADLTSAQRLDARQQLAAQYRGNVARINREYDQLDANARREAAAEEAAALNKRYVDDFKVVADYQKAVRDISANADAERLKTLGFTGQAELSEIRKNAADKKAEIDKALVEQLKSAAPADRAGLAGAAEAEKQAVDRSAEMAAANARYSAGKAAGKELADAELSILQRQGAAGDYLAAAQAKQLAEQKQQTEEAERLTRIANDQTLAAEQRNAAERELRELQGLRAADAQRASRDERTALLQAQAQFGQNVGQRRAAEAELAKQRITDEFSQREAQAQSILSNASATAEQKRQAMDDLKSYAEVAAQQYQKETAFKGGRLANQFGAEENRGALSGVAAAARARREPAEDQVKLSTEANKLFGQMLKALQDMSGNRGKGQPQAKPIF